MLLWWHYFKTIVLYVIMSAPCSACSSLFAFLFVLDSSGLLSLIVFFGDDEAYVFGSFCLLLNYDFISTGILELD